MQGQGSLQSASISPSSHIPIEYSSGYFGKPTNPRNCEPSMYEILTWDINPHVQTNIPNNPQLKQSRNWECVCAAENQKVVVKTDQQGYSHENYSVKNRKKQSPPKSQVETPSNKRPDQIQENSTRRMATGQSTPKKSQKILERPKSAGPISKKPSSNRPNRMSPMRSHTDSVQGSDSANQKLIEQFKQTTRWIPNSAFTTYFGKPAFENYGRGNTTPTYGGLMYGNYLKSHNVQPHRGQNSPKNVQSYNVALSKAQQIGTVYPYPPKIAMNELLTQTKLSKTSQQETSPIFQQQNYESSLPIYPPNLHNLQRFGGKGIPKVSRSKFGYDKQNEYVRN